MTSLASDLFCLVQLERYNSHVKKDVDQLRYQQIIDIHIDIQNMTDITEEQLEKQLSTLPSLDSSLTPTSELEHQLQCQVINVYNGNQKRKDIISHPIQVDTQRKPSNYQHNEGRPKGIRRSPAYLNEYMT